MSRRSRAATRLLPDRSGAACSIGGGDQRIISSGDTLVDGKGLRMLGRQAADESRTRGPMRQGSARPGMLIDLIANASKYSGPPTRIEVTAARRDERVRLSVADRGSGIPAGEAEQLFAAYTRAPKAGLSGIDGAGLGLAIVKSIVDLHGGTVGATRRRGGGSIFWVELPVAADDLAMPRSAPAEARRRLA